MMSLGRSAFVLLLWGCASAPVRHVTRVDATSETDLSGDWNDTDARMTSNAMIEQCFVSPWLTRFTEMQKRAPRIRVRGITNMSNEHIDAQVFVKSIERAMINSGKVRVLAQEGSELNAIRREQNDSASGLQSDSSAVSVANESGADFVVAVRIASIDDSLGGHRVKFYKISFELIDPSTGEKSWIGDHEIKKFVDQAAMGW